MRFPRVRELLETNRVNLSTVSLVAGILTGENHASVLERISGRPQREVEAIVAEYKPRGAVRDSVKPVCIRAGGMKPATPTHPTLGCGYNRSGPTTPPALAPAAGPGGAVAGSATACATGRYAPTPPAPANGATPTAVSAEANGTSTPAASPANAPAQRYIVRFAAGAGFMQQIEAARALLSFRLPANASLAEVLGAVLDDFTRRHDPSRRASRRAARKGRKEQAHPGNEEGPARGSEVADMDSGEDPARADEKDSRPNPRAIPAAVRDEVLAASGGRCEYVGPSGRRCGATMHLQVDHILPVALGGTAARDNLRVLCARHNRAEGERMLGSARLPSANTAG